MNLENKLPKASDYQEELQRVRSVLTGYKRFRRRETRRNIK